MPVNKHKHLHQLIAFAIIFLPLVAVILHPSLPDFFFTRTGYSLDDISDISSSLDLSKALSQQFYNNRNHVHSPHIYGHFQRASPQGLVKEIGMDNDDKREFIHVH